MKDTLNNPPTSTGHAEASPSQVHRILACPGSRRLKRGVEEKSSSYAEEGTMLHEVTERRIRQTLRCGGFNFFDVQEGAKPPLDQDQTHAVDQCVDYATELILDLQGTEYVGLEASTSMTWIGLPEVSGHADMVVKSYRRLDVIDWKFGAGIPVYPDKNIQGMCYTLGLFNSIEELMTTPDIRIHIGQPRLGYMGYWATNPTELIRWIMDTLHPGILKSREEDAECIPGVKQCRFCIGNKCDARREKASQDAMTIFSTPVDHSMTDEEVSALLDKADYLKAFISDLKGLAMGRCASRRGFAGHKMVAGRMSRKWIDPEAAEKWLVGRADDGDVEFKDLHKSTLVSVAQAEKLEKTFRKDKEFNALYAKIPGAPIMVPDSDRRKAIVNSAVAVFKDSVSGVTEGDPVVFTVRGGGKSLPLAETTNLKPPGLPAGEPMKSHPRKSAGVDVPRGMTPAKSVYGRPEKPAKSVYKRKAESAEEAFKSFAEGGSK